MRRDQRRFGASHRRFAEVAVSPPAAGSETDTRDSEPSEGRLTASFSKALADRREAALISPHASGFSPRLPKSKSSGPQTRSVANQITSNG
jgi:hypothetical protein